MQHKVIDAKDVVIRFAGDSGDGMQLTGTLFANLSAVYGNGLSTFPDYPAEIRAPKGTVAGVSGFQVHIGSHKVNTPGDFCDMLVAMNPAALKANAKDICVKEAKGKEDVAKAELEAQYKPSPKATQKVAEARADAAYSVAKEKCDDLKGNEKDVCQKDAKAAQVKAKEDAKVAAAQAKPADNAAEKGAAVAEARKDANAEKNDANYKAAKERCDALSGDAKSKCVDDMKRMYGKS